MGYAFKVLETEVAHRRERLGPADSAAVDQDDAEVVLLAETDQASSLDEGQLRTAYDTAQDRDRVWRRTRPEDRALMWEMGTTDDRAVYRELVMQGFDWPGIAEAFARSRQKGHREPGRTGSESSAVSAKAAVS